MAEINPYQATAVRTATPVELVLMVYDECITALRNAEEAFQITGPERIERIGNNLLHAQDAITELSLSLDMERGGEIAENLSRLYDFMTHHLSDANTQKEIKPVQDVRGMMQDLRDTWAQVAKQVGGQNAPTAPRSGRISIAG
jgi:flagellar protein FliS